MLEIGVRMRNRDCLGAKGYNFASYCFRRWISRRVPWNRKTSSIMDHFSSTQDWPSAFPS